MNNKIEHLIHKYRYFLFKIHGRPTRGILQSGTACTVEDPTPNVTHGDVVHPCIRFISEGFEGHQWWMVYTPYYGKNYELENPRLCYADAEKGEVPTQWKYYCTVKDKTGKGYNSDPTMLFHEGKLYVYWREWESEHVEDLGYSMVTFGCVVSQRTVTYFQEPILYEEDPQSDHEISPTILAANGKFKAYAPHQRFNPQWVLRLPQKLISFLYKHGLVELAYLLVGTNRMKNHGVAYWEGDAVDKTFQYIKTIPFKGVSRLYLPWHMDLFEAPVSQTEGKENLFAVIQTEEKFADICMARYKGDYFQFYSKPLITSKTIGMIGIYKPTAVLINDTFYLYYTARDNQDTSLNRLFVTSMEWKRLLEIMEGKA